jgi:hypothetical protein
MVRYPVTFPQADDDEKGDRPIARQPQYGLSFVFFGKVSLKMSMALSYESLHDEVVDLVQIRGTRRRSSFLAGL